MNESANILRHANFLREMGLPVLWRKRGQPALLGAEAEITLAQAPAVIAPENTNPAQLVTPVPAQKTATATLATTNTMLAAAPNASHQVPQTAAWDDGPGLPSLPSLPGVPQAAQALQPQPILQPNDDSTANTSRAQTIAKMDWLQLEQAVAQCTACGLCRTRTQAVLGVGDKKAQWLLVGEGPGRTEDAVGEPFVGKSGKLLDNMLSSLGLQRGRQVYIANIVKCRPTDANGNDRPPSEDEAAACRPFLERQMALLQPRLVLTLGKTAAISLLGLDAQTAVSSLRGKVQSLANGNAHSLPLIATYHPAYLLRKPGDKARAWADLCLAQATLAKFESDDAS